MPAELTVGGAIEAAADYLRYTSRMVASGLSPEAWSMHERALARWNRAKAAAQAAGVSTKDIEQQLRREIGVEL